MGSANIWKRSEAANQSFLQWIEWNTSLSLPMDTPSSIRHRFDVEIPRGKFVKFTLILEGESTWRLWHRFDVEISTWIRLSKSTKYRWVLHVDFSMSFRRWIEVTSVLTVSIVSFPNIFFSDFNYIEVIFDIETIGTISCRSFWNNANK